MTYPILHLLACARADAFGWLALAAATFLRSLAGFGFPLFAPAMYRALGYGKGDTLLAVLAIALGCPAPWLFWRYGERIRKSSRHRRLDHARETRIRQRLAKDDAVGTIREIGLIVTKTREVRAHKAPLQSRPPGWS